MAEKENKIYQSNIEVVSMSKMASPPIVETYTEDFVLNGDKNSYYQFLVDMYVGSATNNAILNELARLVYGKGLTVVDKEGQPTDKPNIIKKIKDLISTSDLKKFIQDRLILGQASFQIIYKGAGNRKKIASIQHFPIQTLAPKKISINEKRQKDTELKKDKYEFKGEVESYYYHADWSKHKKGDKLKKIPAFGYGENIEIFVCKPYCPGMHYFSPVDYSGSLDYCMLECEIAKYQVNDIRNGFAGTTLINIQRNVENSDKMEQMVYDVKEKLTGAEGDKTVIFFNATPEEATKLEKFPLDDAPEHYEYLAQEAARKILTGHRVTSPKLLGVPAYGEQAGFGNNANEIEVVAELFHNTVVKVFQQDFADCLEELMKMSGIKDELGFVKIDPIDFDKHEEKVKREAEFTAAAKANNQPNNDNNDKSTVRTPK